LKAPLLIVYGLIEGGTRKRVPYSFDHLLEISDDN